MKKELRDAFEYTLEKNEQLATRKQLKSLRHFQDMVQDYVSIVCNVMILQKKQVRNQALEMKLTFECRNLFVDLYKKMHENQNGIKLLEIKEYQLVIEVLLAYSFRLTNGLHQIEGQEPRIQEIPSILVNERASSNENFSFEDMGELIDCGQDSIECL